MAVAAHQHRVTKKIMKTIAGMPTNSANGKKHPISLVCHELPAWACARNAKPQ